MADADRTKWIPVALLLALKQVQKFQEAFPKQSRWYFGGIVYLHHTEALSHFAAVSSEGVWFSAITMGTFWWSLLLLAYLYKCFLKEKNRILQQWSRIWNCVTLPFLQVCWVVNDAGFLIISILALPRVFGRLTLQSALRCALCIRKSAHSAGVSSINKHQPWAPLSFYGNPLEFNFQIQILGTVGSWGTREGAEKPEYEPGQSWPLLGLDLTSSPCLACPWEPEPSACRRTSCFHSVFLLLSGNTSASPRWVPGRGEGNWCINVKQAFLGSGNESNL